MRRSTVMLAPMSLSPCAFSHALSWAMNASQPMTGVTASLVIQPVVPIGRLREPSAVLPVGLLSETRYQTMPSALALLSTRTWTSSPVRLPISLPDLPGRSRRL